MPKVIVITSKKDGFRRCGIAHSSAPTEYPMTRFTPEQLGALNADPMLVVYEKEVPEPEPESETDPAALKSGKTAKNGK